MGTTLTAKLFDGGGNINLSNDQEDQATHSAAPAAFLSAGNPAFEVVIVLTVFFVLFYVLHLAERAVRRRRGGRKE